MTMTMIFLASVLVMAGLSTGLLSEVEESAKDIAQRLEEISRMDIKIPELRALFNDQQDVENDENDEMADDVSEVLERLKDRLDRQFGRFEDIADQSRSEVEGLYHHSDIETAFLHNNASHKVPPCCYLAPTLFKFDPDFQSYVNNGFLCQISSIETDPFNQRIDFGKLESIFRKKRHNFPDLRWQYHYSFDGHQVEYPSARYLGPNCQWHTEERHRKVIYNFLMAKPRYFMILFDRGNNLTSYEMAIVRKSIDFLLNTFTDRDQLGFLAFAADTVFNPLNSDEEECSVPASFVPVTTRTKLKLQKFLNVVQPSSVQVSDYVAISKTVQEVMEEQSNLIREISFIVISAKNLKESELLAHLDSKHHVTNIFMRSQVYNVQNVRNERQWNTIEIDSPKQGLTLPDLMAPKSKKSSDELKYFVPYFDPLSQTEMVSLTSYLKFHGNVVGLSGFDVGYQDLLGDLIFFGNTEEKYALLLEFGDDNFDTPRIVFHPKLYSTREKKMSFAKFEEVETIKNAEEFIQKVTLKARGNMRVTKEVQSGDNISYDFLWSKLKKSRFVLVIAVRSKEPTPNNDASNNKVLKSVSSENRYQFPPIMYLNHQSSTNKKRLMGPDQQLCQYFKTRGNLNKGSMVLSPLALSTPSLRTRKEFANSLHNYMAFLTDQTRLIANPGLKTNIKRSALKLSQMIYAWQNDTLKKEKSKSVLFVVEKFAAIKSGISVAFPATNENSMYPIIESNKYKLAANLFPGKMILTGPFLHPSGAGYSVSLSESVSGDRDDLRPVAGLDMTLTDFEQIVTSSYPPCFSEVSITCFVFDHIGNLIYHPIMTNPSYSGQITNQHLNHKEPNIGKDLMMFPHFAHKQFCRNLLTQTTAVTYKYNVDIRGSVVSSNWDTSCHRFNITAITGTNVFLGILNVTCPYSDVFCPCNINSNKCFICPLNQEEAKESCECPCECPSEDNYCQFESKDLLPICDQFKIEDPIIQLEEEASEDKLENCLELKCDEKIKDKNSCQRLPGCAWCEISLDYDRSAGSSTFTPLTQPFCSEMKSCFNGAVGAQNPYERLFDDQGKMLTDRESNNRSPVGPVIGGILVFFLFLAFSVFCYRHAVVNGEENCHGRGNLFRNATDRTSLRRNIGIEEEDEFKEIHDNRAIALSAIEVAPNSNAVISPYKMNPGYRRPPPGTDSDHGYSTMTPLGDFDSEILPYTASAPARERLRHRPPASLQSVTSGVSSRTSSPVNLTSNSKSKQAVALCEEKGLLLSEEDPQSSTSSSDYPGGTPDKLQQQQKTTLPNNQIVVAATVHMVDT